MTAALELYWLVNCPCYRGSCLHRPDRCCLHAKRIRTGRRDD